MGDGVAEGVGVTVMTTVDLSPFASVTTELDSNGVVSEGAGSGVDVGGGVVVGGSVEDCVVDGTEVEGVEVLLVPVSDGVGVDPVAEPVPLPVALLLVAGPEALVFEPVDGLLAVPVGFEPPAPLPPPPLPGGGLLVLPFPPPAGGFPLPGGFCPDGGPMSICRRAR